MAGRRRDIDDMSVAIQRESNRQALLEYIITKYSTSSEVERRKYMRNTEIVEEPGLNEAAAHIRNESALSLSTTSDMGETLPPWRIYPTLTHPSRVHDARGAPTFEMFG